MRFSANHKKCEQKGGYHCSGVLFSRSGEIQYADRNLLPKIIVVVAKNFKVKISAVIKLWKSRYEELGISP